MRKRLLMTLLALTLSIVMVSLGTASPTPTITQTDTTTTVYLDPATINGTAIGVNNNFTLDIMIADAVDIYSWQGGLKFNATLLECLDFNEGEFLMDRAGPDGTYGVSGIINNTIGEVSAYAWTLLGGTDKASGSGRLAYATFRVKALGVSNIHIRDIMVTDANNPLKMVPFNIIDVYTVPPHTVVTVSNSTGYEAEYDTLRAKWIYYHSGFYNYAIQEKEISFNVSSGPSPSFSNVTIPKALLEPEPSYGWGVMIDGRLTVERTITENATHTSIYFTYSKGDHKVKISTAFQVSTISMDLSSTSATVGSTITISGGITPPRPSVNVTAEFRESSAVTWTTIATVTTDSNGNYTSSWKTEKTGTYEVRTRWDGDETYLGDASKPTQVEVKGKTGIPLEIILAAVGAIVIVIVIVIAVYFVKVRKAKPE